MSRRLLVAAAAAALCGAAAAQPRPFVVTAATEAAAGDHASLVRLEEVAFTVERPGRATTRVRRVVTAFGPAGREAAGRFVLVQDGFDRLRRFEGTLRDRSGHVVHELGRGDLTHEAIGTIYHELQASRAALYHDAYPFTVEWSYEVEHDGVLGWPTWRPQRGGAPVEQAAFTLVVPAGTTVRALARGVEAHAAEARGRTEVHRWTVAQRPAPEVEPFGPPAREQLPELRVGTDRFEIGGAPGRLDSWSAFGAWYRRLGDGRRALPEAARAEVRRVVAGARTDREKARRLYRHLQQTTRYVSIQLGLGGWQPFPAEEVFDRRYGDCKALTNYLQALLAEAGVEAEPVLVEAGAGGASLDPDFPDNHFNHVVLRVPMRTGELGGDEAVWLECTSPYAAFGHLGAFTEGRHALRITPAGGELIRTPTSPPQANAATREATLRLAADGSAEADVRWTLLGEPRAEALARLSGSTAADRARALAGMTGLSGFDVTALDLGALAAAPDTLAIAATLALPTAARRAAGRLLVPVAPLAGAVPALPPDSARTHPLRLGSASATRDSVRLVAPDGYALHRAPPPVEIESPAGRYTLRATSAGDALVVTRELVVSAPRLPAEAYAEVRAFFDAVARADAEVAVFKSAGR